MELLYAIAEVLDIPNEWIIIDRVIDDMAWFHNVKSGAAYSCRTVRGGKFLKRHSIRYEAN